MTFSFGVLAVLWGAVSGYLCVRVLDSICGLIFCVHGIFAGRWKKLRDKNATGLIRTGLILKLALKLSGYALLAGYLLEMGDSFVQRTYHFSYTDAHGALLVIVALSMGIGQLRISGRRLKLVWALSHEFDFAERRERTRRLQS